MTSKEQAARRAAEIKRQLEADRRQQIAEQLKRNQKIRAASMGRKQS